MTQSPISGRCLCGACRFTLTGPPNWIGHCCCESCRRATASPYTTWIGQPNGTWKLTGPISTYASSPGRTRGFCTTCGTPMFYETHEAPSERHFYAALLNHPDEINPTEVYHKDEQLGWAHP
ncbi:MAG: GFA family protein [Pseudomonadota bacterium]|jgi:hypothetical protein|nr:GFA family protein [Pseudomonadota bacterium]MEE3070676.1 GFA family protein [Pseudomonadota bacterium]